MATRKITLQWQDPPPTRKRDGSRKVKYQAEAAELRANPRKWALFMTRPVREQVSLRSKATWISTGRARAFETGNEGRFETCVRLLENGNAALYVRYVPTSLPRTPKRVKYPAGKGPKEE